jgi:hypothetical protein
MRKTILIVVLLILALAVNGYSQNDAGKKANIELLKSLKKAESADLDQSKPLTFNSETDLIIKEDGTRVSGTELELIMASCDFVPEPYINDKKEVIAFLLRPTSEEEKTKMLEAMKERNSAKTTKD